MPPSHDALETDRKIGTPMILAFFTLSCWGLSLLGWGMWLRKGIRPACQGGDFLDSMGVTGLLGIASATAVGTLTSFLAGLGGMVSAFFLAAGGLLLLQHNGEFRKAGLNRAGIVLSLVILLLVTSWSARPIMSGDTGIYHMQAVQWIAGQPVVPGLANLHGRFGFNSSWWTFAALLELPGLSGLASHLANPLLLFFCGLVITSAWKRFLTGSCRTFDAIPLCATFLWLRQGISWNTPSLSNDTPANLLVVVSLYLAARGLEARSTRPADEETGSLAAAAILGVFLFTIKLNTVVLMSGLAVTAFWVFRANRPALLRGLVVAGLLIFPWMTRGYLLSGYPAYPATFGGLSAVPWKTPEAQAAADAGEIRSWPTRNDGGSQSFFTRWLDNQMGRSTLIAGGIIGVAALGLAFFAFRKGLLSSYRTSFFLVPALIAVGGVAFVLLTAPAFRFLSGYAFAFAGLLAGPGIAVLSRSGKTVRIAAAVLVILPSFVVNSLAAPIRFLSLAAFPPLPIPDVFPRQTSEGFEILVTGSTAMTWNAPRPATMGFAPGLRIVKGPAGTVRMFLPAPAH